MRLTDPLNNRQIEVLRWIAAGCPDGVMAGHSHKTTARALQARRLITISKGNGEWFASVTDAGSHYLEHGSFPPKGTSPNVLARTVAARPGPGSHRSEIRPALPPQSSPAKASQPPKLSRTDQLVKDVAAAGGVLEVSEGSDYDRGYRLDQLVRTANRLGKTPPGKRLVRNVVSDGTSWLHRRVFVVLDDGPAGTDAPLLPVPVLDQVGRYHPAVSALQKSDRLRINSTSRGRALRILHAIAEEAERRGFRVASHKPISTVEYRAPDVWHLLFQFESETVPLRISEESDRVEHVATTRELAEQKRHPWMRIPSHDQVPSGRLRVDLGGAADSERRSFWADRASWNLEDKLPELLREMAVRADELRLRREAKTRAEAEYEQAVRREEERARARAAEAYRCKLLEDELARWREVRELRNYAAAMAERIEAAEASGQGDDEAISKARQWLGWVIERANRRDPTTTLPTWPNLPQLRSFELNQFMNRVEEPAAMRYRPVEY